MSRAVTVLVLALVGVAACGATAAGQAGPAASAPVPAADPGNETDAGNVSLGASISAFMQASAERATQAINQGMWSAAFLGSDRARKHALAESHVGTLRESVNELQAQRRALVAAYRNGSISRIAFQARMSALGERYRAIQQSIEDTRHVLNRGNVDAPSLADLDQSLEPSVAAAHARNVSMPANVTVPEFDDGAPNRRVDEPSGDADPPVVDTPANPGPPDDPRDVDDPPRNDTPEATPPVTSPTDPTEPRDPTDGDGTRNVTVSPNTEQTRF